MNQSRLFEEPYDPVYFYHKEIQSDKGLSEWHFEDTDQIQSILEVIESLDNQTAFHNLAELELDDNPEMFIESLLRTYPDHLQEFCTSIVNDFSDNMMTRAREAGKYVVLILFEDSVVLCHTNSDEKTISKDKEVIERLLDSDNVDKYARFQQTDDGIEVFEFEQHLSKSFSEWLGLQPEEIAYKEAGEIKIFTEIDDSTVRFEYEQDEFAQKFLIDEDFRLIKEIFETPNDKYPVKHIKIGRRRFETVDEFMQEFYSLYFDLKTFESQYQALAGSMTPHVTTVVDHKDKVTKGGPSGKTQVVKSNDADFRVIFSDKSIELSAQWRLELSKRFRNEEMVGLHHVGMRFSEEPVQIGPFDFYNELDVDKERLNQLYAITQEAGTGEHLSNIIYTVIFHTISEWTPSPICYFFSQLSKSFEDELDAEGLILRDEGGIMELKSRNWLVDTEEDEEIAKKITEEIQADSKLVLVGIEEEEQRIRPVNRNRFDSERNGRIKDAVREVNGNHDSIQMSALPLGRGECLMFVYSVRGDQSFDLGLT